MSHEEVGAVLSALSDCMGRALAVGLSVNVDGVGEFSQALSADGDASGVPSVRFSPSGKLSGFLASGTALRGWPASAEGVPLERLREEQAARFRAMMTETGLSRTALDRYLDELVKAGMLKRIGPKEESVYVLPSDV